MTLNFPPIYILDFKIGLDELHKLEQDIESNVYDINEAKIIIGNVTQKRRVEMELRQRKLFTEDVTAKGASLDDGPTKESAFIKQPLKRKRTEEAPKAKEIINLDSSTSTESEGDESQLVLRPTKKSITPIPRSPRRATNGSPRPKLGTSTTSMDSSHEIREDTIKVLNIRWYYDSKKAGAILPIDKYLVYEGRKVTTPKAPMPEHKVTKQPRPADILSRAQEEALSPSSHPKHGKRWGTSISSTRQHSSPKSRPSLLKETTSEHDIVNNLPPIPAYLHSRYSCQRPTPLHSPNEEFINLLTQIKKARTLTSDDISVRAYSSAIGTLASYPYTLTSPHEVHALPGCGEKISKLYQEWRDTGRLQELDTLEADHMLHTLKLFYDIYGVAAITAHEFYHRGWRDLDDVTLNWSTLSREQQIGLKFYDDFQVRIPREEVEKIAAVILEYANRFQEGFQMCIVGGYRRGQETSGDVDVILTHPEEEATRDLITSLVKDLEEEGGWVTHSLKVTTSNSRRDQNPVSWKGVGPSKGGGFDTLDSAFLVWQDPEWPGMEDEDPAAKNPNLHRRVDIIISPWKTAGCAILGWSGGTTFERDLRWYCKNELGLKFDSSGIRNRSDGRWIDVEGDEIGLLRKEKKVFEYLKLEWREPTERCTG